MLLGFNGPTNIEKITFKFNSHFQQTTVHHPSRPSKKGVMFELVADSPGGEGWRGGEGEVVGGKGCD